MAMRAEVAIESPGVGWLAAPDRPDWLSFNRDLRVLEALGAQGMADDARFALYRLLDPFGGTQQSSHWRESERMATTAS
jgi:hypothetical protein